MALANVERQVSILAEDEESKEPKEDWKKKLWEFLEKPPIAHDRTKKKGARFSRNYRKAKSTN